MDSKSTEIIARSSFGTIKPQSIPSGLYVMRYDENQQTLRLEKNTKKGPGGSHQEAWALCEELVDKLKLQAESDPIEYTSTAVELNTLKNFLVKSTAKYNPPDIRGEINYQLKGGTWIFEQNSKKSIGRIQRSIISDKIIMPSRNADPDELVASNKVIISIAKATFQSASERFPKSICRSIANKYSRYIF